MPRLWKSLAIPSFSWKLFTASKESLIVHKHGAATQRRSCETGKLLCDSRDKPDLPFRTGLQHAPHPPEAFPFPLGQRQDP